MIRRTHYDSRILSCIARISHLNNIPSRIGMATSLSILIKSTIEFTPVIHITWLNLLKSQHLPLNLFFRNQILFVGSTHNHSEVEYRLCD